jgi:hypothetical protein
LVRAIGNSPGRTEENRPARTLPPTARRIAPWATFLVAVALAVLIINASVDFHSDPAVLAQIRARFASEPWSSDIIGATWDHDSLDIESTTSNQDTVMDMCRRLTVVIEEAAPADGDLFIWDASRNLLASNFLDNGDKCYWRDPA